jgi:sucrose-phosphate synthase
MKKIKDKESYKTLKEVLFLIDDYDLYQHVAIPKTHTKQNLVDLYQYAATTRGVFVNPAHFEPFGLTLLEAAASGLPVIATKNGGSKDIVKNLNNGILVDPSKIEDISNGINQLISDKRKWKLYSRNGIKNIFMYTWNGHVQMYMGHLKDHVGNGFKKTQR